MSKGRDPDFSRFEPGTVPLTPSPKGTTAEAVSNLIKTIREKPYRRSERAKIDRKKRDDRMMGEGNE